MSTTSEPRLKDRLFNAIRAEDKSLETAKAYWHWIEKFIRYHGIRHPKEMGESEVRDFLSSLAVERNYAPATQDVAYNALAYLYKYVLDRPLDEICNLVRSRKPKRLPEVFTIDEVARVRHQYRLRRQHCTVSQPGRLLCVEGRNRTIDDRRGR